MLHGEGIRQASDSSLSKELHGRAVIEIPWARSQVTENKFC